MLDGLRCCSICKQDKDNDEFRTLKSGHKSSHCKECAAAYLKDWREKNAEKLREQRRLRTLAQTEEDRAARRERERLRYYEDRDRAKNHALLRDFRITLDEYNEMLAAQNGGCAICGKPCKSGRRLAVDHCHDTGKLRGLLCMNCNRAIGWFEDDVDRLMAAAAYILSHRDIIQKEVGSDGPHHANL